MMSFRLFLSPAFPARAIWFAIALTLWLMAPSARAQGKPVNPAPPQSPPAAPAPNPTAAPNLDARSVTPGPDARVEYFGAEGGYAVGTQSVTFLGIVRNVGAMPLPERALRLRCLPIAGLDYTTGDTLPFLPALARNQAVAFRWRFAPPQATGPLIAGLLLERAPPAVPMSNGNGMSARTSPRGPLTLGKSEPPAVPEPETGNIPGARVTLAVVPRFSVAPRLAPVNALDGQPYARLEPNQARIGNDRVQAQVLATERRQPLLMLAGRDASQWHIVATSTALFSVLAGEDGQTPWRETFRWRDSRVREDRDGAQLTLVGEAGSRWGVELILDARRDTAALSGRLRLTARRTLRCFGVQLPRLLTPVNRYAAEPANGAPLAVEEADAPAFAETNIAADRANGVTFGIAWPSAPPLDGWRWSRLPGGGDAPGLLGAQAMSDARGAVVVAGATLEFPFRLFAFGPSDTIRDALRFALP